MAVEAYLPMDLLMDAFILCAVQLALGRFQLRRLVRALALLCAHTLLAAFAGARLNWLRGWQGLAVAALLAAALLTGSLRPRRVLEAAACMGVAAAVCAGFAAAADGGPGHFLPCAVAGLMLLLSLLRRRRHIRYRWNIELSLERNGVRENFPALIDTGNRLREHRSGLPVLIVEARAIPHLARLAHGLDPSERRSLPYGVLGGAGELECFLPDRARLRTASGREVDAPPCWVAVYPGRIPGRTRALAPPEFAEAADREPCDNFIQNTIRRFFYAVFKRETVHLWPCCTNSKRFGVLHRRQ